MEPHSTATDFDGFPTPEQQAAEDRRNLWHGMVIASGLIGLLMSVVGLLAWGICTVVGWIAGTRP